jgi:hypothetical protein
LENSTVDYTLDAYTGDIMEQPAEPEIDPMPEGPDEGFYDPTMDMIGMETEFYDPFLDEQQNYYTGDDTTGTTTASTASEEELSA